MLHTAAINRRDLAIVAAHAGVDVRAARRAYEGLPVRAVTLRALALAARTCRIPLPPGADQVLGTDDDGAPRGA